MFFFTSLLCLSIFFIYITLIQNFIHRLEKEQLATQQDILKSIQLNAEEQYNKIIDIIVKMHNVKYETKTVSEIIEQGLYKNKTTRGKDYRIESFLNNISAPTQGIYDIILIKASNGLSFYGSNIPNRSVIAEYDFLNDYVTYQEERFTNKIQFHSSYQQPYIIGPTNQTLIQVTGSLVNINNLSSLKAIGYYIININPEIFLNQDYSMSKKLIGHILIYQDDNILYNNSPFFMSDISNIINTTNKSIHFDETYLLNKKQLKKSNWTICHILPKNELAQSTKQLYIRVFRYIIIIIVLLIVSIVIASIYYNKRINKLMKQIESVENGNLDIQYTDYNRDEIGQLSQAFNKMCINLKDYIQKEYILNLERKNATITALQTTINPHFLYNTLDAIRTKSLVNQDYDTSEMITLLGNIFRWSTETKKVMVRIEDELEYAMCYLTLQNIRFENTITIDYQVNDNVLKYAIPKFTLQPLVENAIHHGIENNLQDSLITIKAFKELDNIILTVSDNGLGIKEDVLNRLREQLNKEGTNSNKHIGLRNINQRLKLIYGKCNGLTINSKYQQGTTITIIIPCTLYNGDDDDD
jgi:sensor histidine kinase YesM